MPVRKLAAGNRDSYLGFFDPTTGIFCGGTPTLPSAGQASGMVELLGVQEVPLTALEPENIPDPGDDTVLATFQFDNATPRAYIITMAVNDMQTDAWLMGTNVEAIAGGDWGVLDVLNAPERNVCLLHQSRAKYFDPSNRGQAGWEGALVPLATCRPLGRQTFAGRAAAIYRLAVVEQLASYNPWGVTFTSAGAGTDSPYLRTFRSANPYHMVAWAGNASLVIIPVDHEPLSVAKSSAWSNLPGGAIGIPQTISSVSIPNKTETVSAALALGTYGTLLYQYRIK